MSAYPEDAVAEMARRPEHRAYGEAEWSRADDHEVEHRACPFPSFKLCVHDAQGHGFVENA
jgi:hypothetical protein